MDIVFWGRYSDDDDNIYKLVGKGTCFKDKNKKMYILAPMSGCMLNNEGVLFINEKDFSVEKGFKFLSNF